MRATTARLSSRGFWGRSIEEFKRLSKIALSSEGIKGPSGPFPLHDFHEPSSVRECKLMCDVDIGGFSRAALDWIPPVTSSSSASGPSTLAPAPGHARFHGSISTALPADRMDVQRSGFAAWRTLDRPPTLFGRSLWDIDSYSYLGLRVRSDGRSYLVNVQTESVVPSDLHQHRLFARRPGEWETVHIKWNDFVRTNHGFVVEPQTEMLRRKVRSVGVGLTDRVPGPFELCIERVWATNDPTEDQHEHQQRDSPAEHSERSSSSGDAASSADAHAHALRNKAGKNISWND